MEAKLREKRVLEQIIDHLDGECQMEEKKEDTQVRTDGSTDWLPRNAYVLCRAEKVKHGKLTMPDHSPEGERYVVVAMGPDVKDLTVGYEVKVMGRRDIEWSMLPGSMDHFCIHEKSIAVHRPLPDVLSDGKAYDETGHFQEPKLCGHCGRTTAHKCKEGNVRDSTQDYQECTVCGWYKYANSRDYYPPSTTSDR